MGRRSPRLLEAAVSRRLPPRARASPGRRESSSGAVSQGGARRTRRRTCCGDAGSLNVDSERCYPDEPGGVAETVRLLAEAGAAGCSVEDYNPALAGMDELEVAAARVAEAAAAARELPEPLVITGRAENHIHGVDDLDDTIARLLAYRDAGAEVVYAPGLTDLEQIATVVAAVGVPVNVLALPERACSRRARVGRRSSRVHGQLAHRSGIRRAAVRSERATRARDVALCGAPRRARRPRERLRAPLVSAPA